MNRDKLAANMADQIKEAQLKLGYAEETVRLYYPLSSLRVMCDDKAHKANKSASATPVVYGAEILAALKEAFDGWRDCPLGKLSFTLRGDRMEISIPPEGVKYVHEQVEEPAFLSALIALFQENHHCSISDVCKVFEDFHSDYVCERLSEGKAESMGFDYVLYFKDGTVDAYYYCIKEEMGHTIYHRFTKEDYELLVHSMPSEA